MTQSMRLQKYLSQAWICSRRKAEEYINDWQVIVNWKTAILWMKVDPENDIIRLWSRALKNIQEFVYYKFYKPRWVETTCAQRWWKSIIDIIETDTRVFPVWRLDKDSTGLILLTNDGRITNYLTHPRYWHEKEYIVEVFWLISDESLSKMSHWVQILWKPTLPCTVTRIASWKFSITLKEWRNRQIRRMVEAVWWKVKKLKRVRIENILLGKMSPWELLLLSKKEKDSLYSLLWIQN